MRRLMVLVWVVLSPAVVMGQRTTPAKNDTKVTVHKDSLQFDFVVETLFRHNFITTSTKSPVFTEWRGTAGSTHQHRIMALVYRDSVTLSITLKMPTIAGTVEVPGRVPGIKLGAYDYQAFKILEDVAKSMNGKLVTYSK